MAKKRRPFDCELDGGNRQVSIERSNTNSKISKQKIIVCDDEDLENIPPEHMMVNENVFPKMSSRCCAQVLVNTIREMSEIQKNAIRDIGFEHILALKVTEVPSRLCYWILQNFEPKTCEITLQDGRRVRIHPADVQRVFGFPRGKRLIVKKKKHHKCELTALWRGLFPETGGVVVLSTLSKMLLNDKEGGEWFKRHFMILLTTCLIESNSTGCISPQIMHCFNVVSEIAEWDWGDFVIKCLIDHTLKWKKNPNNPFVGPSLFITAWYVDRVILYSRAVPRSFPTVVNWDNALLRNRQAIEIKSGGFGGGYPDDPIDMDSYISHSSVKHTLEQVDTSVKHDAPSVEKYPTISDAKKYAESFVVLAQSVAGKMVELMSMVENAPTHVKDNIQYKQMVEATQNLIGGNNRSSTIVATPTNSQFIKAQGDDEFWTVAQGVARIHDIENAMAKRDEFVNQWEDDVHNLFSLGLTQEFKETTIEGVNYHKNALDANIDNMHPPIDAYQEQPCHGIIEDMQPPIGAYQEKPFDVDIPNQECPKNEQRDDGRNVLKTIKGKQVLQEINNVSSHQMVRRNINTLKKTPKLLSPTIIRAIDTSGRLSKTDRELCFFALHNRDAEIDQILFINDHMQLKRREMLSMRRGLFVSTEVVDVWCEILNYKENLRSSGSPSRFYATTTPCMHTIVNPRHDLKKEMLYKTFEERFSAEIDRNPAMKLKEIDMFFFPMVRSEHFFVVCVDVRKSTMHIIDSDSSSKDKGVLSKYDYVIGTLKYMFRKFMSGRDEATKALKITKAAVTVLDLPWVDRNNKFDCGIYTMRHMETYKGDRASWRTGLKVNSNDQISYIRVKYCAAILVADINNLKNQNIQESSLHNRLSRVDGPINLDDILLG